MDLVTCRWPWGQQSYRVNAARMPEFVAWLNRRHVNWIRVERCGQ